MIASVTEPFCASCDRVRLTADGQLRTACSPSTRSTCGRCCVTGGADDDLAAAIVAATVAAKWAGHPIGQVHFIRPRRSMSQIGG